MAVDRPTDRVGLTPLGATAGARLLAVAGLLAVVWAAIGLVAVMSS